MTRKAKIFSACIIGLLALSAGGLYALPYVTLYQIKEAVEQSNSEKLARYIDFTAVRQDLKEQLKGFLSTKKESIQKVAPLLELLGADLVGRLTDTMVDRVVDTLVTPAGMDELMRGKIILEQVRRPEKNPEGLPTGPGGQPPDVSLRYKSTSQFVADIVNQSDPSKKAQLILTRRGLHWKLTAVKLPLESIPWPNIQ